MQNTNNPLPSTNRVAKVVFKTFENASIIELGEPIAVSEIAESPLAQSD